MKDFDFLNEGTHNQVLGAKQVLLELYKGSFEALEFRHGGVLLAMID